MDDSRKNFEDATIGDVIICYDEYSHDYVEHKMVVTSIENDPCNICEDNPKGRTLYGHDISDESVDGYISVVNPGNFVGIRPVPTTARELFDYVVEDYQKCSVELNTAYLNFKVKMPEKEILLAWKELEETVNSDYVCRIENDVKYDENCDFIPEGEFEDVYEGNCMEYLDNFKDPRFHRFDDEYETSFIY